MKKEGKLFFAWLFFSLAALSFSFSEESDESKRKDILRFGLENEITDLISLLRQENDVSYNEQLLELFAKSKSPALRENIIGFFAFQKNDGLKDYAVEVLANPYDYKKTTVLTSLAYVSDLKLAEASAHIRKILEGESLEYRDSAISALGKIGNPEDAPFLFDYLEGEIEGDEKQRLIIRQNIMAALGELKAVETWDRLIAIAEDTEENVMIRASAATAVGSMGKAEAVPVLAVLYEDTDPVLRMASITGLSNFNTPESVAVILEGFKDSFYKVRIEAIGAAEKMNLADAMPYILYRAKSDPVETVKMKAFEALGKLNASESNAWLASIVNDPKAVDKVRVKACAVLIGNSFDFIYADVEKIMIQALADDKKKWIRYELGKILAAVNNPKAAQIGLAYIASKDTLTKSLGMDMYDKNRYPEMRGAVEEIAADDKMGALQRRAKKILEK